MEKSKSYVLAVGGGEFGESGDILDKFFELAHRSDDPKVVVMTVATEDHDAAVRKYNSLFRARDIRHVQSIEIASREDSFSERSVEKIAEADALFFTGGDQLNITTLLGGSPLHETIRSRVEDGIVIVGTSAGAAMMSRWMILSGVSDKAPAVGAVEIGPGMGIIHDMIIDTHFSQRGRHGRLLTAIAHYPQALGVGIDSNTAILACNNSFEVLGEGCVTVIDGGPMKLNDLPYRKKGETIGISGALIDVLHSGFKYEIEERRTVAPELTKLVGAASRG